MLNPLQPHWRRPHSVPLFVPGFGGSCQVDFDLALNESEILIIITELLIIIRSTLTWHSTRARTWRSPSSASGRGSTATQC